MLQLRPAALVSSSCEHYNYNMLDNDEQILHVLIGKKMRGGSLKNKEHVFGCGN